MVRKRATVEAVLEEGTCSGCGACVLAGHALGMQLDACGNLRPMPGGLAPVDAPDFAAYCPAVRVSRPHVPRGTSVDPDFGPHLGVWAAHATDPQLRHAGSSGGVLSALATHLLESGDARGVAMVRGAAGGTGSEAVVVRAPADVPACAGSRYAPVSTLPLLRVDDRGGVAADPAVVCRPCEASALAALVSAHASRPVVLSFFCAGVPSQRATDALVRGLGIDPTRVRALRYRGMGWPGDFQVVDDSGASAATDYADSWGRHLGPHVQSRCKMCVDGVGESADVAAADLWEADERGYPRFSDAPGRSLLIARTPTGMQLVRSARAAGVIHLEETDLDQARLVQQLQVTRRRFLLGRLIGRALAGRSVPTYQGFGLVKMAVGRPVGTARQALGSFRRATAEHAGG